MIMETTNHHKLFLMNIHDFIHLNVRFIKLLKEIENESIPITNLLLNTIIVMTLIINKQQLRFNKSCVIGFRRAITFELSILMNVRGNIWKNVEVTTN